jgi:hypothetical protein
LAKSEEKDPKSIVAVRSPSNVASGEPFGRRRVTVIIWLPFALPATTIRRSGCTSTARTLPVPNISRPSPSKSGSSKPFARNRATMAPPVVAPISVGLDSPAMRIRPLAWRAIASPESSPPKSAVAMPPVPNVESSAPFAFRRASCTFPVSGPEKPATRSLPFGSTSTPSARPIGPHENVLRPSPENVVSSRPLLRSRATQNALGSAPLPATTILPFGCTSTAFAESVPPKLIVFLPVPAKLVSRSPGAIRDAAGTAGSGR